MFKPLLYILLFIFCACTSRVDNDTPQPINTPIHWQFLIIELNDTVIRTVKAADTLEVITIKEGVKKHPLHHVELDSLFSWSNELINFRGQPKSFCTDYVGKLKVRIRYNPQLLKEVSFSSLCNWYELDSNTKRINQLLKQVTSTK